MKKLIAYCFRNGVIEFSYELPEGAIEIAQSCDEEKLKAFINVRARHGYNEGELLIPGVPEAQSDDQAILALAKFIKWLGSTSPDQIILTEIKVLPNGLPVNVALSLEEMP